MKADGARVVLQERLSRLAKYGEATTLPGLISFAGAKNTSE